MKKKDTAAPDAAQPQQAAGDNAEIDIKPDQNAEEAQNNEQTNETAAQDDETEKLRESLAQANDKYMRLVAEFDNYKKRTLRERMDLLKTAGEDLLTGILPVVDDFERANANIDKANDIEAVKKGVELIYNKFIEFLKHNGVSPIEAMGQELDTDLHEAITKIPAPNDELKGKVVDVVKKGYTLNDKVIRYAQVVIGE